MSSTQDFWVVGVGASAGGLEALSSFFKSLPEKPAAAFIVAQHLAPHARSMMVELLSRQTQMPVMAVEDRAVLRPGAIFIVPPNYDVTTTSDELRLIKAGEETRPKPSVDLFFTSLAKSHGQKAVAIILSGTGSDGSEGIRAVKEAGGITLVQDTDSAKYDGMPKSAFETGLIDAVLSPEKMAQHLFTILKDGQYIIPEEEMDDEATIDFQKILQYLKQQVGTDFSQYKISTIQRRIEKRLATLGVTTLPEYYKVLKGNQEELLALSQNMLVSVTSFFRDTEAYESMAKHLEEIILSKKSGEELRVWSAGCATGEEPYSLAMLITDLSEKHRKHLNVKVFATDLDFEALGTARSGHYGKEEVSGIPENYLDRFFEEKEKTYEVRKFVKDMIVFARQDLVQNPPFVKLDMVTCRNVLIYFETVLQARIFDIFHYSLRSGGLLFLGKSESANPALFETVDKKEKIYRRLNVLSNMIPRPNSRYQVPGHSVLIPKKKPTETEELAQKASIDILKMLNVSGVVVDEEGVIVHLLGDVSEYINFPKGLADFRLTNLLPKSVSIEFSVLMKKAEKEAKLVKSRAIRFDATPKKMFVISIMQMEKTLGNKALYLVAFEPRRSSAAENDEGTVVTSGDSSQRLIELEQELSATKENLQTLIEELEISNEELQSLNEELSSTNEELQASNEELETTNEELQSTNEELMTLNEELNVKSLELRQAYTSLDNIQGSIGTPIIVVGQDLRLIRYNGASSQIFNFNPKDLQHPITKASCQCEIPDFEKLLRATISTGKSHEVFCQTPKQKFQLRIHPSKDENKKIVGAVLFFFDNTNFIHARDEAEVSEKRIRGIIDNSPTLITLKDNVGKYLSANKAFLDFYQMKEDQVIGKTDREIFQEDVYNQVRDNDIEVLLKREPSVRQEKITYRGQENTFHVNRFPLFGKNERNPYAVGSVSLDITREQKAQDQLKISEGRYRAMIEDQSVYVVRHLPNGALSFSNLVFNAAFGGTPESNLDRKFLSIVHPADQKKVSGELAKINITYPTVQYEHRATVGFSSSPRWIRWIHRGIFDEKNTLVEFQAVGFDVTEIHLQTAELLSKESLYTHVLEHTSDYLSVYRMDDDHNFVLENFNQSALTGRSGMAKLIGKNLRDLVRPEVYDDTIKKYLKSLKSGDIVSYEEEITGPGGTVSLSTNIVPIAANSDEPAKVVVLSRDITKLKHTERALREEMSNAEAANRAKTEFLASMSHELRTPLNVIMGMGQLLQRAQLQANHQKLVDSIQRSSKVLLSLIEDVLDLSKIEAGKVSFDLKPINLESATAEAVQGFESEAQHKGIELIRDYRIDTDLSVLGDAVRLRQVMTNLIGNALKFTEKGTVRFTVRLESYNEEIASVYFEVKDTGIGISPENFGKIFKRFSQADSSTSRRFGGTGLGLAISKQLVELMNGQIGFESNEGQGSTFWFKVQFTRAKGQAFEEEIIPDKAVDFSTFKVLAVDDNPESLRVLKLYFESNNGKLITADSGKEALSLIEKETFDLILMDMQMPDMDGLQTTKKIRSLGNIKKRTPVIALTANAMSGDKDVCLKAGMNDYLTKPVDLDELNKLLRKWL
ncbi:MAG: chemotaxis protein CheB [Bdellovibrionota bacterium]